MQAEQAGDLIYLRDENRELSFGDVNRRVNALAAGLADLGVGRGDRVCFFMGAAIEVVLLVLAVNKLGAVWIPINTDYKGEWLRELLQASRPRAIVVDAPLAGRLAKALDGVPHEHVVLLGAADDAPAGAGARGALEGRTKNEATKAVHERIQHDNPEGRLLDMDVEGVDINLIIPGTWAPGSSALDVDLAKSMHRAYHRYMTDYTNADSRRLKGIMLADARDPKGSAAEIEELAAHDWVAGV